MQHVQYARKNKRLGNYSNHNSNWINKELSDGFKIHIELLEFVPETEENNWEVYEIYWISQLKSWGFSLNNLTRGGEGGTFIKGTITRSEEYKRKLSSSIVQLQGKPVNQYTKEGIFIKTWNYIKEAANELGLEDSNIIKCCQRNPTHNYCGGFIWRYADDDTPILQGIVKKKLYQYDMQNNLIHIWNSAFEAAKTLNIQNAQISMCVHNKIANYKGYIWIYK